MLGGQRQASFRTVSPAPGVTVRLPTGSGAVTAAPDSTLPLTTPVHLANSLAVPSAIAVLAPPRHLAVRGRFQLAVPY